MKQLSVFSFGGETFLASPLSHSWAWIVGLSCSLLIGGAAYWKRSLTGSGWAAAVVVGTLLYALGNLVWFATLIAFFVSSSVLSKWKRYVKRQAEAGYEKTGGRDAWQVAANGLPGTLLCVAHAIWPSPLWLIAFIGIMAAVNADTWATEIGGLSRSRPRSILSGKAVPTGTSGGVSLLGTAASVAGAGFIGVVAFICLFLSPASAMDATNGIQLGYLPLFKVGIVLILSAAIGGTLGAFVDSLLGATLQRMYRCTVCGSIVERQLHCHKPTAFTRGFRWMNNDAVNIISSLFGAAVALAVWMICYQTSLF
ncbi:MAG: DUF92 domain-containing protein [Gorillibacterium sp.]|nr:DUF92 domain-containing protein [Gorillibacterium sp.]